MFTAQDKIRAVLPARTRRQAEALQAILRIYAFPAPSLNFDDTTFLRLQQAIHERQHFSFVAERPSPHHSGAVLMTYRPTGGFDQFAP